MKNKKKLIDAFLYYTQEKLIPLTKQAVSKGNLVFTAGILKKKDLSFVIAGENHELENPLWHGEISCLKNFFEIPKAQRPDPKECIFFSTHEPCSLCLSAITWSGFDNFYYLFTYEETRDLFAMPDDLIILEEVFGCRDGGYVPNNKYWHSHCIIDLVKDCSADTSKKYLQQFNDIKKKYQKLHQVHLKHTPDTSG